MIVVLNQKGGSGKTTIAIHIAAGLLAQPIATQSRPARVLLVDADPQASALDWAAARKAPLFPVIGLPKATLHRELPEVAADYAYTVIDGPPKVNDVAKAAILAADLVLIPIQPSPYEVWARKEIVRFLEESPNDLEAAFIVSRKIVGTAIGRDVAES
jgi:chromosome partitioning protein